MFIDYAVAHDLLDRDCAIIKRAEIECKAGFNSKQAIKDAYIKAFELGAVACSFRVSFSPKQENDNYYCPTCNKRLNNGFVARLNNGKRLYCQHCGQQLERGDN